MKRTFLVALVVCGGAASARAQVNGCGLGSGMPIVDLRGRPNVTITFGGLVGFAYSPACIRIVEGTAVTFSGGFVPHPLVGGTVGMSGPMPDPASPILPTNTGTSATFVLASVGEFGYYCNAHWSDGMFGGIIVEPDLIFADGFEDII
jgi:plastocyanin